MPKSNQKQENKQKNEGEEQLKPKELKQQIELRLQYSDTLKQFLKLSKKTYEDNNLTKQNLKYDLLNVFKETVLEKYSYGKQDYKTLINNILDCEAVKGILKNTIHKTQKLQEDASKDIQETRRLTTGKQQRRAIAQILMSRFVLKYHPRTLARKNDKRMFYYQNGMYQEGGRSKIRTFLHKELDKEYAQRIRSLVVEKVEAQTFIHGKEEENNFFEVNERYLCVQNGILDLYEQELIPHTPRKIFFEKLPVSYRPDEEYQIFRNYLEGVVAEKDDVKTIQEVFGFCLYRDYFLKKAFLFLGEHDTGKSTVLRFLNRLLGKENISAVKLQDLGRRFQKRWIVNKLANVVADLPSNILRQTGDFKGLTGKDTLQYEVKGGGAFNFQNYAKLIYSANSIPPVEKYDEAFFTRWTIIKFPYQFLDPREYKQKEVMGELEEHHRKANDEIIEELLEKQSLSGILNFALEGLQRLFKKKSFTQTMSSSKIEYEWIAQSDSFRAFAMRMIEKEPLGLIEKDDLREAYEVFCNLSGYTHESDNRKIKTVLRTLYGVGTSRPTINGDRTRCWKGIKFVDDFREDLEVIKNVEGLNSFNKKDMKIFLFDETREDEEEDESETEESVLSDLDRLKKCFERKSKWAYEDLLREGFTEAYIEKKKEIGMLIEQPKGYLIRGQ